ncbi:MAG: F0F1 ATP synthase subunit delta [Actinomycetales bacterium]|nr:F0F1 ATP synthase subunit delta [Actinomycetales bacterium]
MGSASRQALDAASATLASTSGVTVQTGEELLAAARALEGSAQLRTILSDPTVPAADKSRLAATVLPGLGKAASSVLAAAVEPRWSSGDELVDGVEDLGIRAVARGAGATAPLESELFAFSRAVASDAELELALGSKLADPARKAQLAGGLLAKKADAGTIAIVRHLVQSPRGRRVGEMLRHAADVVAAAHDRRIATVTSASELPAKQATRLANALSARYGVDIQLQQIVDPQVVGGLRVQVGDDVIDGTIAARLHDLRLQLAG